MCLTSPLKLAALAALLPLISSPDVAAAPRAEQQASALDIGAGSAAPWPAVPPAAEALGQVPGDRPASQDVPPEPEPSALPAPAVQVPSAPFRPRGPFVGVGYGLHRYSMKALSMEQDSDDRRAFDGGYLSLQAGYLASWGGLIGLDWVHHSGKTNLNTRAAALSMRLRSDFVSLLTGIQLGGHVRFHLALLTGVALAEFRRAVRVEEAAGARAIERRDAHASSPVGFLIGLDTGLIVMPTAWLAIGLRARADMPLFEGDLSGTGGLYLGLSAAYVFPL